MKSVICHECGKTDTLTFNNETNTAMEKRKLCFNCLFWTQHAEADKADPARSIIINGLHYMDGGDRPDHRHPSFLGHGGTRFTIRMKDGRVISTNNLWHQGEIPEHFRSRIPDNCNYLTSQFRP